MLCLPSNQLGAFPIVAWTARMPTGSSSLRSLRRPASNTFPFQASRCTSFAAGPVRIVPGATSTVPSARPSGIAPAGLAR